MSRVYLEDGSLFHHFCTDYVLLHTNKRVYLLNYLGLFSTLLAYLYFYLCICFFLYRKQENKRNIERKCIKMSKFQDLPDELVSCGQVSRRIRRISHDGSLWVTTNLERKIVKTELLQMILCKGCKGTIQPGLRLVPSGNFFLALSRSHHFLFKKVRI